MEQEINEANKNLENGKNISSQKNTYFTSPDEIIIDKKYDIDHIIETCEEKDNIELINYMCEVMHEKKRIILETLYKELGKKYLISKLESTLTIENSGGLKKGKSIFLKENKNCKNENKSSGGVFFSLIKNDPEAKEILLKASKKDWKEGRQRRKVRKLLDKLNV